jgi:hypothetical protein
VGRKLAFALILAVGLLVAAGAARGAFDGKGHGSSPNGPHCARRGSRTLFRDTTVRVYSFTRETETRTYACLLRTSKRRWLDTTYEDDASWFSQFQHRGHWLGFLEDWGTKYGNQGSNVTAINMRTGERAGTSSEFTITYGIGLTSRGSLAWLDVPYDHPSEYSVHKITAGARESVLLDSGPDIDSTSLAVAGTHVYWIRGGLTKTASMP